LRRRRRPRISKTDPRRTLAEEQDKENEDEECDKEFE
jgi:hypothetical protein